MSKLQDNPHYQNGQFWGRQMAKHIQSTIYKNLETAIAVKKELVEDLKREFGWDENIKDVAENLGIIASLEAALKDAEDEVKTTDNVIQKINEMFGYMPAELDNEELHMILLQDAGLIKKAQPESTWSEIITLLINTAWDNTQDS